MTAPIETVLMPDAVRSYDPVQRIAMCGEVEDGGRAFPLGSRPGNLD